jgi:hypothetical protein
MPAYAFDSFLLLEKGSSRQLKQFYYGEFAEL